MNSRRFAIMAGAVAMAASVLAASRPSEAQRDYRMTVANSGSSTINEFYATNCGSPEWGHDRLGSGVIPPGKRVTFDLDDGSRRCCFDMRAVLSNGQSRVRRKFDICREGVWSVF